MARIRGRRAEDTRRAAVAAATAAFARDGFEKASLGRIAAAAGVTAPALAYHFGDKAGLRDAVIADVHAGLLGLTADLATGPSLEALVSDVYGRLEARREGILVLLRSVIERGGVGAPVRKEHVGPAMAAVVPVLARTFGATERRARAGLVALTHLVVRFVTHTPEDNAEMLGTPVGEPTRAAIVDILCDVARTFLSPAQT